MKLSLGIDIGTSGVKTATVNFKGEVYSFSNIKHVPQNIDQINPFFWWQKVMEAIKKNLLDLKNKGLDPFDIKMLAVDGTSGTILLTDEKLTPLNRALMYNSSGFYKEAKKIKKYSPIKHITKGSNSVLARALKLIEEDKEHKAKYLMHQSDYIVANLIKKGGFSDLNNNLKLGYDIKKNEWPEWIIKTGLKKSFLPKVNPVGTYLGKIDELIANILGLNHDAGIYSGTTDSNAGFLACAPFKIGSAVTSLGSTLAIKVLSENQIEDTDIGLYSHKLGNFWLAGGASNTGGNVLRKFFTDKEIIKLCKDINPYTSSGLNYYPLLTDGERFPVNDPDHQPCLSPRPKDDSLFLKGLLESMAKIEKKGYEAIFRKVGIFPDNIITVGGGANNEVWKKIRKRIIKTNISSGKNLEAAIGTAKIPFLFGK